MRLLPCIRLRPLAAGLLLGGSLLAVSASAQVPTAPPPPPPDHADGFAAMRGLWLAQRLAGLQIYLGITAAQMPQWNAFTAAVLAMPAPHPGDDRRNGDAFDGIAAMAQHMQQMAVRAEAISHAAGDLKGVLTADQIVKADAAWSALHHAGHGMWHRHGPGMERPGMQGPGMPPPGRP